MITVKEFYRIAQGYTYIYFSVYEEVRELTPLLADLIGDYVIDEIIPGKKNKSARYTLEDAGSVTLQLKMQIVKA